MNHRALRSILLLVGTTLLSTHSLYAEEPQRPRIAHTVTSDTDVSEELTAVVRESVALQLERYTVDLVFVPAEELPEDPDERERFVSESAFTFFVLTHIERIGTDLAYRIAIVDVAEATEIFAVEDTAAIDFLLDLELQTAVATMVESALLELVAPIAQAEESRPLAAEPESAVAEPEVADAPVERAPRRSRGAASLSAILPTGSSSSYFEPLLGTAFFFGYEVPETRFTIGLGTALYRGTTAGDTIDARTVFIPFGLEYRLA
ncbi:MAG: hypothetical protein MI748_11605, partial [Opitutales bacterium]|nr:hypothetical protein [Opitutales bacterium]